MISSSPYYSHVSALLHQFAADTDFTSCFASVFGVEITPDAFVAVLSALPIIEVLPDSQLGGAAGAFSAQTGKIYLPESLLAGDEELLRAVLLSGAENSELQ